MGHPDMLAAAGYGVAALYTGYYGIAAVGGLLLKVYGENLATMPATLQETQVNVAIDLTWTHTRRRYRYNGYGHKTGESQRDIRSASHPITRLFHWDTIASATSASDWERVAYRRAKEAFQRHKAADLRNYGSRAKGADWAWKVRNKY
jgi:hypothetical protein